MVKMGVFAHFVGLIVDCVCLDPFKFWSTAVPTQGNSYSFFGTKRHPQGSHQTAWYKLWWLSGSVDWRAGTGAYKELPHIGEVEIITLSLSAFEPWTLVPTLKFQNQLSYIHADNPLFLSYFWYVFRLFRSYLQQNGVRPVTRNSIWEACPLSLPPFCRWRSPVFKCTGQASHLVLDVLQQYQNLSGS